MKTKRSWPSYKKDERRRSMKKSEFEKSAKRSKMHQRKKRKKRQVKIQKILEEHRGTRNILSTKSVKKRVLIPKVKNKKGENIDTRQGTANVFAEFYESLYEGGDDEEEKKTESRTEEDERISDQHYPFQNLQKNEVQDAIDRLTKGKAKDSSGVRAEQLKNCSDETKEKMRTIFNEITRQKDFTSKSWRKIQVIYKKGDREYFVHVSLHPCTKSNLPTKVGFGPIIELMII